MTKHQIKIAELALIKALPEMMLPAYQACAIAGKLESINKKIDKHLDRLPVVTDQDKIKIRERLIEFEKQTGWTRGNGKAPATLILFAMALLDDAEYQVPDGVLETLTNIILHMEDHPDKTKRPAPACYWAADQAVAKWRRVKT